MSFIADAVPLSADSISTPTLQSDFVSPIALIRERFKPISDIISTGDYSYPFHLLSIIPPPVYFSLLLPDDLQSIYDEHLEDLITDMKRIGIKKYSPLFSEWILRGRGYDLSKGLTPALLEKIKSPIRNLEIALHTCVNNLLITRRDFLIFLSDTYHLSHCWDSSPTIPLHDVPLHFSEPLSSHQQELLSADTIFISYAPAYNNLDCDLDDVMTDFRKFSPRCPTVDSLHQHKLLMTMANFDSISTSDLMTIHAIHMYELHADLQNIRSEMSLLQQWFLTAKGYNHKNILPPTSYDLAFNVLPHFSSEAFGDSWARAALHLVLVRYDYSLLGQQPPFFRAAGGTDFDLSPIITVRPFVQLSSPAASAPFDSKNICTTPSTNFNSGQESTFLANAEVPGDFSAFFDEFTNFRESVSNRLWNLELLRDRLDDDFTVRFQDFRQNFNLQFGRLHSRLDSYVIANDLKVHHLQSNFENLNRKISALLESSKPATSPIPISTSSLPPSAPIHPRAPSFFSRTGPFSSPAPLQDDDVSITSSVSSPSLSSAPATSIILQDQHRLDASTRAMLNLDLKKIEPKGRIKDRDSALLFFQQWRAYVTAGGTKSLRLLLENPTNPQDPLSTNLAGLGLHLSADPDKLQDSIYLEETIMAIFLLLQRI